MTILPQFTFTHEQLLHMLKLQAEANDVMSTDWRTSSNEQIPYYRAAYMEAAEAIGHHGYKWWKANKPDWQQIEMEVVDILHFALSEMARAMIQEGDPELTNQELLETYIFQEYNITLPLEQAYFEEFGTESNFVNLCEQYMYMVLGCNAAIFRWVQRLFQSLEVTRERAYNLYIGKNVLNKFRTHHGQRGDTYVKVWHGKEDNEVLYAFLSTQTDNALTEEAIWNFLEAQYSSVIN